MRKRQDSTVGRAWLVFFLLVVGAAAVCGAIYLAPARVLQSGTMLVDHDGSTSLVRLPVIHLFQRMALAGALAFLVLAAAAWWRKTFFSAKAEMFVRDARDLVAEIAAELRDLTSSENRWKLLVLGLIIVAGVTLRVLRLDDPIRFDEAYTFNVHSSTPFFNLISDYTTPNNHVFHSVLVRCSYLLFGDSPLALRLPALMAGILVIPATFWCMRRVAGDTPAVLASALAAGSAPLVSYSANARGYTILALALLIVFSLAIRLRDRRNLFTWTLFVVVLTLGFFTVPIMLYGACVVGVWLLLSTSGARRRSMFVELSLAAFTVTILTCALYAPVAVRVGIGAIVANPFVRSLSAEVFLSGLPDLIADVAQYWGYPTPLLCVLLVALAASVAASGETGRQSRRLHAALWIAVPAIVAAQRVLPYTRVFVMLFPLGYGLAGAGLTTLVEKFLRGQAWLRYRPVLVSAIALMMIGAQASPRKGDPPVFEELPTIIAELKPMLREGDVIFAAIPLNEPLRYHARRAQLPDRTVEEIQMRSGLLDRGENALFYMIEEKNPPRREFVTFRLPAFKIDHPFLKEHFQEPEQVLETPETRVFRMRLKPGQGGPRT